MCRMMDAGVAGKAQLVKWSDTLDALTGVWCNVAKGLQLSLECHHPDAQWLASLFAAYGSEITQVDVMGVLVAQGNDPRALLLRYQLGGDNTLLKRAAELGNARAQAEWSLYATSGAEKCLWMEKAAAQGDRKGCGILASTSGLERSVMWIASWRLH